MDKKNILFSPKKLVRIDYDDTNSFFVDHYINPVNQAILVKDYIELYFADDNYLDNYLKAEWNLIFGIVDKQTDIPVNESDPELNNQSLEILITSGTWDRIKDVLFNYTDLRNDIDNVVNRIKEEKALDKSVGNILDTFSGKITEFLNKISEMDLSESGLKNLVAELQKVANQYDEKFNMTPKPKKKVVKKDLIQ
jgi:hypothetical protein